MRTSRRHFDENYIKLPDIQPIKDKEIIIINENKPPTEKNNYIKQLENNRFYYQNNKQEILKRNKKNYELNDKNVLSRNKIIYLLNNDAVYKTRVRPSTLEKYNIKIKDGIYI